MSKPKIAFYWCASCGGCEEAVVDLADQILPILEKVDIVFWPVALDFKKSDIESLPDKAILASFINGSIRTSEQLEMAQLLRQKSQLVIAFGSCAYLGGIPALANLSNNEQLLKTVYREVPSVEESNQLPSSKTKVDNFSLEIPELLPVVKTLNQVIQVDYYLPGCAPPPNLVLEALTTLLENKLPSQGSVLAPPKSLCDVCPRKDSKPEKILVKKFKRLTEATPDPEKCFLAEGFLCLGPVTRSGCGERCIKVNQPCEGCFGPVNGVEDQGAKYLSALASILDATDENEIKETLSHIFDPAGKFYLFSLAHSIGKKFFDET